MKLISVDGPWDEGLVLDNHILESIYLRDDENGRPKFQNTRTELGDILFTIKYRRNNNSNYQEVYDEFIDSFTDITSKDILKFIKINNIDVILGAPFSTKRNIQPVDLLCDFISNMTGVPYIKNVISKKTTKPSKDMKLVEKKNLYNQIEIDTSTLKKLDGSNVLIIDDLYQTGTTLEACTKYLQQNLNYVNVYVLCMTKTRG